MKSKDDFLYTAEDIQMCFLPGDDEWTFPQTPSSLQNSVWGSKLWPSQSPLSNAGPDATLLSSTSAGEDNTEGDDSAVWEAPAKEAGKAQGQSFNISVTCGDKPTAAEQEAAAAHEETNPKADSSAAPEVG